MSVPRYDIVPIPPRLRGNLRPIDHEFPFEVVETMYAFNANEVVQDRASAFASASFGKRLGDADRASVELFRRAGRPTISTHRRRRPFLFSRGTRWWSPRAQLAGQILPARVYPG